MDVDDLARSEVAVHGGPPTWSVMMARAEALYRRYEQDSRNVAALDAAIGDLRRCLDLVPSDDPERLGQVRLRLGTALCKRWEAEGGTRFAEGVELLVQAVDGLRTHPAELAVAQANLAGVAPGMYQLTSDRRWQRAGIGAARRAVALGTSGEELAAAKENLALNLLERFEWSRDSAALHEAMVAGQVAVRETDADGPDRARRVCLLARTFWVRYQLDKDFEDVDLAVRLVRAALRMVPRGHVDEPAMMNLLAAMLRGFAPEHRDVKQIEEAVALSAAAVAGASAGGERLMFQLNHVATLLNLHAETGRAELLPIADSVSAEVLGGMPSRHTARAAALLTRGMVDVRRGDVESALRHLEDAVRTPDAPYQQIKTARQAAALAARSGQWAAAAAMLAHAVSLLPRLVSRQLLRVDQERLLAEFVGLVREACAHAIQAGDAAGALVVLEHGRELLFRQLLDDREDLRELRRVRPDLADRIETCRAVFEPRPSRDPAARDEVHAAAEEWDRVVAEARALPGFGSLFARPGFDELRAAAADGPVVVINVASLRTDALVLTSQGIDVVELPDAGADVAQERFRAFMASVDTGGTGLPDTLAWLWDAIAAPVLDRLGIGPHDGREPWRRIWWSPTGPLVFLPLQHAGRHDTAGDSVMDRVVSSSAPSIQALLRARNRPVIPAKEARLVVVSVPGAPGYPSLSEIRREVESIRARAAFPVTVLDNAVRADVLDALPMHPYAHLACHVDQSVRMPTAVRLVLADYETSPLTLQDIARLDLTRAEFLFLSACATGRGGIALTEELIDLASAFQVAGYRHVVATLWPIADAAAVTFTRAVYRVLTEEGVGNAALAVHRTARAMRDHGWPPFAWASYFHTGP